MTPFFVNGKISHVFVPMYLQLKVLLTTKLLYYIASIYLEIKDESVTNPVQNDAIQLGGAEHQTAPPCSKESGYSVLNHPTVVSLLITSVFET